jgi:hypothetical protein
MVVKVKKNKGAGDYAKWDKAVLIPIKELVFTDWNCNEMSEPQLAELASDIENPEDPDDPHFDEALQVVPIKGKKNRWLVLGGHHRTKIMNSLNQDTVPCVVRWDLKDMTRRELMMWTVRRNHLRGKVNAEKFAKIEDELIDEHGMAKEAARRSMQIDDSLADALRSSLESSGAKSSDGKSPDSSGNGSQGDSGDYKDADNTYRDRETLLKALKIAEQDVLLDSADTVEHGYLFFAQGKKGQLHLVVNESKNLFALVAKMVSSCKGNSAKVDDFLASAIQQELGNWE